MYKCICKDILVLLSACIIFIIIPAGCCCIHKADSNTNDLACKCDSPEYIENKISDLQEAINTHTITIRKLDEENKELRRKFDNLKERGTPINVFPYPFVLFKGQKADTKSIPLKITNLNTSETLIIKIGEEKDLLLESDDLDINNFQSKIIKIDMEEQNNEEYYQKVTLTGIKQGEEILTFKNGRKEESRIAVKVEMPLTVLDENEHEIHNSKPFTVTCRGRKIFVKSCSETLHVTTDPQIQGYLYIHKGDKNVSEHHNSWPIELKAKKPGKLSIILKNDIGEEKTFAVRVE